MAFKCKGKYTFSSGLLICCCLLGMFPQAGATVARANFLNDQVPFGNLDQAAQLDGRLGYSVVNASLEEWDLQLTEIPEDASLTKDGAELLDLRELLQKQAINESHCNLSSKETRLGIGQAMLEALESRFQKQVIHLADTSRVSGGYVYGEATVRDTSDAVLRNAHHVFHVDKYWDGIGRLVDGTPGKTAGIRATLNAMWPLVSDDFAGHSFSREDYENAASAQSPGVLNLWVSLTPGKLVQHPLAVLLNEAQTGKSALTQSDIQQRISTMHGPFKALNESITLLRSRFAQDKSLRWAFKPEMTFGQAVLFFTDRTPHSAVWLPDGPSGGHRQSAEIRVLVSDRPLTCSPESCM